MGQNVGPGDLERIRGWKLCPERGLEGPKPQFFVETVAAGRPEETDKRPHGRTSRNVRTKMRPRFFTATAKPGSTTAGTGCCFCWWNDQRKGSCKGSWGGSWGGSCGYVSLWHRPLILPHSGTSQKSRVPDFGCGQEFASSTRTTRAPNSLLGSFFSRVDSCGMTLASHPLFHHWNPWVPKIPRKLQLRTNEVSSRSSTNMG